MRLLTTGLEVLGAVIMFIPPLFMLLWQAVSHGYVISRLCNQRVTSHSSPGCSCCCGNW
jgi:hypothetical protein